VELDTSTRRAFAQRIDYRVGCRFARKINLAKNDNFVMMRETYE
jgi:hypothetical protein